MSIAEEATLEVHQLLNDMNLPYAIIGGAAVQVWAEPRFTQDLDLTVLAPIEFFSETIEQLLSRLEPRIDNARDFAQRSRVLLLQTSTGYPVDISFGLPGYEEEVISRSVEVELTPGKGVRFCSPEDLIIHKSIAGRVQDMIDIQNVIVRQKGRLDLTYTRFWLKAFGDLLETSEVLDRFEDAWRQYGPES